MRTIPPLLIRQQFAQSWFVFLRILFLSRHKTGRPRATDAFARHFANDLGGGKDFFLALARHDRVARIFAHSTRKNAIISGWLGIYGVQSPREPEPMDEREFFDEKSDKKPANLSCPHCHQSAEYEIQWLVRTKKKSLPPRADDRDRAKFAKAQSYMLRRDDMLMCKNVRCRKRFEITGVQSVAFLD